MILVTQMLIGATVVVLVVSALFALYRLAKGPSVGVPFTIPEGFTVAQIVDRIAAESKKALADPATARPTTTGQQLRARTA